MTSDLVGFSQRKKTFNKIKPESLDRAFFTRKGWNGADQWFAISCPESKEVGADNFWSPHNADFARKNGGTATVAPCITLKNAQNQIIMGWIPSAGDLFAEDWMVLPND